MVQVIWASSPSTKGTARTLCTNRGGTAGPRECGETRERLRDGGKETERQRHRKKKRQRWRQRDRKRETGTDKQMDTEKETDKEMETEMETETQRDTMRDQDPTPRLIRYSQPSLQLCRPCAPNQGGYLYNAHRLGPGHSYPGLALRAHLAPVFCPGCWHCRQRWLRSTCTGQSQHQSSCPG